MQRNSLSVISKLIEVLPAFYESVAAQRLDKVAAGMHGRLATTGVGKSGYVARKVASTFATIGLHARFMHPTEALHGELGSISPDEDILVFSAGGETQELYRLLDNIEEDRVILFTANSQSGLPHRTMLLVPHIEEAPPVISSVLLQLLGDGLALEFARCWPQDFKRFHPGYRR